MIKVRDAPHSHSLVVLEGIGSRDAAVLDRIKCRAVVTRRSVPAEVSENQVSGTVAEFPQNDPIADGGIGWDRAAEHGAYGGIGFRPGDVESGRYL